MTVEEMKWFATLGVGGVLAGITFYFYRLDRLSSEKMLQGVNMESRLMNGQLLEVVRENTRAVQVLTETINGKSPYEKRVRAKSR